MNKRGFTLVELLVVMAIITILAAIAVPNVTRYIARSRAVKAITEIKNIELAITKMVGDAGRSSLSELFDSAEMEIQFGDDVCDTAQDFQYAMQIYTNFTYALLKQGRGALVYKDSTDGGTGLEGSVVLKDDIVKKLGTSYFEDIGVDAWGENIYQIYPGPWPRGSAAANIPFRTFTVSDAQSNVPGTRSTTTSDDVLTLFNIEDPDTGDVEARIGYPAPLDKVAYIYSTGANLVSGQAIYSGNGYDPNNVSNYLPQTEILMGGGDDPNNWDADQSFMRFYN
ncbi:MAG: type II secretion system protein [Candidatus Hydrogenedentes bacterium]|nr:type II secretion system protein [Candidatus Hydrogenedentota bacterium]